MMQFTYELLDDMEAVREQINLCEGHHVQQAIFSTFMDTLTQVCFTEQKIRSTIGWEGNRSWPAGRTDWLESQPLSITLTESEMQVVAEGLDAHTGASHDLREKIREALAR